MTVTLIIYKRPQIKIEQIVPFNWKHDIALIS